MHSISVTYHTAGSGGSALYVETFPSVNFDPGGIFNIILGQAAPGSGFPASFDFNQQYWIEVSIDNQPPLPRTPLWSVPYAFNACTVGGLQVSYTPANGKLWPVPVGGNGKISATVLPPNNFTISGVSPDGNGNINITGSNGITITPEPGSNSINISGSANQNALASLTVTGNSSLGSSTSTNTLNGNTNVLGSTTAAALTVTNTELAGGSALMVKGGVGASNPTGVADGTGLTAGSPQTYWADQVAVPSGTAATMTVYNALVSATSTIVLTPVYSGAGTIVPLSVSGVAAGQFTVNAPSPMGTSGGGSMSAINYIVVNH